MNASKTTANALYLACDYNANTHCLGSDTVGVTGLILSTIGVICAVYDKCPEVWRKITKGSGSIRL